MRYLLDTTVLIDHAKDRRASSNWCVTVRGSE